MNSDWQATWVAVLTVTKVRDVATSPPPPPYTLNASCLSFGMWGCVLEIINHAKFQLDRFRGLGAPGGRKSLSPIDWRYRPYNSVRTNVLHCDNAIPVLGTVSVVLSLWLWVYLTNIEQCLTVADPQTKPNDWGVESIVDAWNIYLTAKIHGSTLVC